MPNDNKTNPTPCPWGDFSHLSYKAVDDRPTLDARHFSNLIEEHADGWRMFRSRMTVADGAKHDRMIEIEVYHGGMWRTYGERFWNGHRWALEMSGRGLIASEIRALPRRI